jgi:hypothetical protein
MASGVSSNGGLVDFPGSDANHLIDRRHENLPVTDLAGSGASNDGVKNVLDLGFVGHDCEQFGMKVDLVFATPVKLGVPFMPPETDDFGKRETFDTDVGKVHPYLLQTLLSNYGIDPFHCGSLL